MKSKTIARLRIIEAYLKSRRPLSLITIARKNKTTLADMKHALSREPKLRTLCDLRPVQAARLIEYYGQGILFTANLEKIVMDYITTRKRIKEIEKKFRGR